MAGIAATPAPVRAAANVANRLLRGGRPVLAARRRRF
jgi:hypothetical protein